MVNWTAGGQFSKHMGSSLCESLGDTKQAEETVLLKDRD
jgi:hypothetical protein